jgi:hypothetical protein
MGDKDLEDLDVLSVASEPMTAFNMQREITLAKDANEPFGMILAEIERKAVVVGMIQEEISVAMQPRFCPALRAGLDFGDEIATINSHAVGSACTIGIRVSCL